MTTMNLSPWKSEHYPIHKRDYPSFLFIIIMHQSNYAKRGEYMHLLREAVHSLGIKISYPSIQEFTSGIVPNADSFRPFLEYILNDRSALYKFCIEGA